MRIFSVLALFLCIFGAPLAAQQICGPNALEPRSVLLFTTVDSRAGEGKGTIISVANTNDSKIIGQNKV